MTSWGIRGVLLEEMGSRGRPQGRSGQGQVGGERLRVQRAQGEGELERAWKLSTLSPPSLVGDRRSHMSCGVAKKKKRERE